MSTPLVSALITIYNREKYVAAAIESVLAQTMQDFEIVIVDDCSSDRSLEIARRYETDPRVQVHVNEANLGDFPNRNRAASLARGKYLKYVDADDIIYPHCLALMTQQMEEFPEAGLGVALCSRHHWICPVMLSPREAYLGHFFGKAGVMSWGPLDTLIRRDHFEANGGFDGARYTSDYECALRLARSKPVVVTNAGLVWWRHHPEQESVKEKRSGLSKADVAGRRFRIRLNALRHPDCPLKPDERLLAIANAKRDFARLVLWWLRRLRPQVALECLKAAGLRAPELWHAFRQRKALDTWAPSGPHHRPRWLEESSRRRGKWQLERVGRSPVVSVLIPAYNAKQHIREAIESVLAQRFGDWELIIVDDASTDRTYEIAQSYANGKRIRCFRNNSNLGKWANYNRCAELSRGSYLKFLDSDDLLYPHCLQQMVDVMKRHPETVLVQCDEMERFLTPEVLGPRAVYQREYSGLVTLWESPTGAMYRRSTFNDVGGFRPESSSPHARLHLNLAACGPVFLLARGLAWYRRGSQQVKRLTVRGDGEAQVDAGWRLELLRSEMCPLTEEERAVAHRTIARSLGLAFLGALVRGRLGVAAACVKCAIPWLATIRDALDRPRASVPLGRAGPSRA